MSQLWGKAKWRNSPKKSTLKIVFHNPLLYNLKSSIIEGYSHSPRTMASEIHLSVINLTMKYRAILMRFIKGAIAGAVSSMAMVSLQQPSVWVDFVPLLQSLGLACAFGAITGLLLAAQKWASWEEMPPL